MMWFVAAVALAAAAALMPIAIRARLDRRAAAATREAVRPPRPLPRQITHRDAFFDEFGRPW